MLKTADKKQNKNTTNIKIQKAGCVKEVKFKIMNDATIINKNTLTIFRIIYNLLVISSLFLFFS